MSESETIPLSQNEFAIVDTKNLRLLNGYKWSLGKKRQLRYARRWVKGKTVYMHRVIMNAPAGVQVDHINGNGLDNRKANLRLCNYAQNQQNRRKRMRATSLFKGVGWHDNRWRARIRVNGKQIEIGRFKSEFLAAEAYDQKAVELFGEFAHLNFPSQKSKLACRRAGLISEKKQNTSQAACPPPATSGGKHKYVDLWHCGL